MRDIISIHSARSIKMIQGLEIECLVIERLVLCVDVSSGEEVLGWPLVCLNVFVIRTLYANVFPRVPKVEHEFHLANRGFLAAGISIDTASKSWKRRWELLFGV